jgi:glycosyltransferase involved in cell wall biosynthesis
VQDSRAERRAAAGAWLPLAYSPRAASLARGRARTIPIAHEIPATPGPFVDEPVVALVADWRWAPNRTALATLLRMWPDICERVSGARLLLAGRGAHLAEIEASSNVDVLGEVARSEDVLARAALVAFPCPPTSGPKIKVLEALAFGVPVVTTAAGVEGLFIADVAADLVAAEHEFAGRVVTLLTDAARRADVATRARAAVAAAHAPRPAAQARIAAIEAALAFERPPVAR